MFINNFASFSKKYDLSPRNLVFLGALSGFTSFEFASKSAQLGAGAVTLGGFCIDEKTYIASQQILKRGRSEFNIAYDEMFSYIKKSVNLLQKENVPIFLNVRFVDPEPLNMLLNEINHNNIILEVNAHCRQPEVTSVGAGQSLVDHPEILIDFLNQIDVDSIILSLKLRANLRKSRQLAKLFINKGGDILHLDSYQIGEKNCDISLIKEYKSLFPSSYIIGNNSINHTNFFEVLNSGASAISVARKAQFDPSYPGKLWNKVKERYSELF